MLATLEGYELGKVSAKKLKKIAKSTAKATLAPAQTASLIKQVAQNPASLKDPKVLAKLATTTLPGSSLVIDKALPMAIKIKESKAADIAQTLAKNPLIQTAVMSSANILFPGSGALIAQGLKTAESVRSAKENLERPIQELIATAKTADEKKAIIAMKEAFDKAVDKKASEETTKEIKSSAVFQSSGERYYEKGKLY